MSCMSSTSTTLFQPWLIRGIEATLNNFKNIVMCDYLKPCDIFNKKKLLIWHVATRQCCLLTFMHANNVLMMFFIHWLYTKEYSFLKGYYGLPIYVKQREIKPINNIPIFVKLSDNHLRICLVIIHLKSAYSWE